ncbi:putative Phosphatidylinositol transfer protein 1 [Blattamonas nauphoetae]|uniref:Phosphatidylinositol transfer protein 1 n=1 Tax=Blattamonas nauphoetae TaxID=2049346 RepID=A0ABQ9XEP4_9EUKA|nr:putative Phosphatidylinositol transfer protein 1 [Blattamonas nauphoetae]
MKIYEYQIHVPLSFEEFPFSQRYMTAKASTQNSGAGEGVETLKNEPYTKDGVTGVYTFKRLHIASKVPKFIRAFLPKDAMILEEECWNAFPFTKTTYKNVWLKDRFEMTTTTRHVRGVSTLENAVDLPPQELKIRRIEVADIAEPIKKTKEYTSSEDATVFHSEKSGRGPLTVGWWKPENNTKKKEETPAPAPAEEAPASEEKKEQEGADEEPKPAPVEDDTILPVTTAHKVVKIIFKVFGFQTLVENYVFNLCRNIFTGALRQQFCWMDEWYGWTEEELRAFEAEQLRIQQERLKEEKKEVTDDDDDDVPEAGDTVSEKKAPPPPPPSQPDEVKETPEAPVSAEDEKKEDEKTEEKGEEVKTETSEATTE